MMNKIILKIVDDRQYILSKAYRDLDLQKVVNTQSKKTISQKKFNIFDSVDTIELNDKICSHNFYIFPIFYAHEESEVTIKKWYKGADLFIKENLYLLSNPNVFLLICDPFEASVHLKTYAEKIKKKYKINLWVYTADKKIQSDTVDIIYHNTWLSKFQPFSSSIDYKPEKLYINLTRVARYHRCRLLEHLIENNLLNLGYNSWGDTYNAFTNYVEQHPDTKISSNMFKSLDIEDLSSINPNFNVPINHCINSFVFLSTETNVKENVMFFSEKSYKPIGIGMPFIILGNPGTLKELRNDGFITFNEWFDESYDNNLDLEERIKIIIKNLKKFSKYSNSDLEIIRKEMHEVTEYNLNLYKIIKTKNTLLEKIKNQIGLIK